jgi:predicted amidohydrolase YtcJ
MPSAGAERDRLRHSETIMSFTVYENGVFHTMVPGAGGPQEPTGMVVSGASIAFLGTISDCRDFVGGDHARVDLGGAHVVPGFTDSHIHTAQLALQSVELDLSGAQSLEETLALVKARLDSSANSGLEASGGWVFGGRWNNRSWADRSIPTKRQLDAVTGDTPVALHHSDLHTYWLNSAALRRLGITDRTADPVGGSISRDVDGEATGILGEAAAFDAERYFAAKTSAQLDDTIGRILLQLLSFGVTTIHDIDGADALRAFRALRDNGQLGLRIHKLMPVSMLEELIGGGVRSGSGDDWLRYGAVKIFGDGSLSSQTCLLHQPYPGDDNNGIAVTPLDDLREVVQRANAHGLAAAVHAIGDGAVSNAISALEEAEWTGLGCAALPNRIEHLQHAVPADIERFGALNAVACMQPASCTSDIDMVDELLAGRTLSSYAWRSILEAGGTVAFSSDAPVESINPFTGIYAAVTRQRPDGYPSGAWGPKERLTRSQAFGAYMCAPAIASGESAKKGRLTPGRLADFAVLDRDPFSVDDSALLSTEVVMTAVGGAIRWSR